jgi:hypothetical protein
MSATLVVLLSHQKPPEVAQTMAMWAPLLEPNSDSILLAYGGDVSSFKEIDFEPKVFIEDPRLRLKDLQRERQSLFGVLHAAAEFLNRHRNFDYVLLVEYDHVPLVGDLLQRMINRLEAERADVLAYHLHRIDGTSSAHYLYHVNEQRFHDYFAALSARSDKRVILSMLGTGSFWTHEAFETVATREEPFPIYFELYLPTLAHHLGFRLRDLTEQNQFVRALASAIVSVDEAKKSGAWTLHPVKHLWNS